MNEEQQKLGILIIDDDDMIRSFLRLVLLEMGFDSVAVAGTGEDARKRIKTKPPQLILLDIHLPDIDGVDLLVEIQKECPKCYVVMVSTEGTADRVKTAISKGAKGFIVKPINAENVINQVQGIIDKHF